jgi:SAM-dependent methyltransferase
MSAGVAPASSSRQRDCPICLSETHFIGTKVGSWRPLEYRFRRCKRCRFIFVENPSTDYENIYNSDYYAGRGADPLVDYHGEIYVNDTVRKLEWQGVAEIVTSITTVTSADRWLDYGCGNGGLVDYLNRNGIADAEGFDQSPPSETRRLIGSRALAPTTISDRAKYYDVISAIEVFEHLVDPMPVFTEIARLLKPGGLLFYTTGNTAKFEKSFFKWSYVRPEIHVSYFSPATMRFALDAVGLEAITPRMSPVGKAHVLQFKVLKNLGVRKRTSIAAIVPWQLLSRVVEARYGVFHFPLGMKGNDD